MLIFSVLTAGIRRRGGGGRVQRSGGIDGTHGPLIGGGREGGGPSLAGGAPPPPVRVAWQRGRQLLEDPCPSGKCVRASRCDLNDRTVRVTLRHVTSLCCEYGETRLVTLANRARGLHRVRRDRAALDFTHVSPRENYRFIWSLQTISVEKHVY